MVKTIKYFTLYLIILGGLNIVLIRVLDYTYTLQKTGFSGGKINQYLSLSTTPEVLIMGHSRALYQVIPDSISQNTYNLGHAGTKQSFQTGLLSILIEKKRIPKTILLHVDPEEYLFEKGFQPANDIQQLKYYYGKNELVTRYINEISKTERIKYLVPVYRYNGKVLNQINNILKAEQPENLKGYEPCEIKPNDSINTIESWKKDVAYTTYKFEYRYYNYLKTFIELCRSNSINLICYTSPFYRSPEKYLTASLKIDSILRNDKIPYINFITEPILQLENNLKYWSDSKHLNHFGAAIESEELRKRMLRIFPETGL